MKVARALVEGNAAETSKAAIAEIEKAFGGESPALVVNMTSTPQDLAHVNRALQERFPKAVVLGSSTAGAFTEAREQKGALAIFAVAGDVIVSASMALSLKADVDGAIASALGKIAPRPAGYTHSTAVLLVDPLSGVGEEAVLSTASRLDPGVRLAGGAAGDDLRMVATEIALGEVVASDAAAIALLYTKVPLGVGVSHGHEPITRPVRVTKAEGAVVYEIEDRPAWDVWKEYTKKAAAQIGVDADKLNADNIGAFLLRFEAGLANGDRYKIRAPLSRGDDGSLNFACGIPEGAMIRITESVPERQITSARDAAKNARKDIAGNVAGALVFDCICRSLILGDEFMTAVKAISDELGDVPLSGFETYGEIALDVGDMSGFHNTTTVVLAFPVDDHPS